MKNKAIAILLTLLGFFGVAGIQYFYTGKIIKGLIFLFTGGVFLIGTIISLFTISMEVDVINRAYEDSK